MTDTTGAGTSRAGSCFDGADRLLATTGDEPGAGASDVAYDGEGAVTSWRSGDGTTTSLGWDGGHRNTTATVSGGSEEQNAASAYARDATDRVVARSSVTQAGSSTLRYSFTADGDTADLVLNDQNRVLTRTFALPGGVLYTRPGASAPSGAGSSPEFQVPSIRGDIALTWTDVGVVAGPLHTYTPDGQPLTPTGTVDADAGPDTQPGDNDYGWLGQHQKTLDHAGGLNLVQMGARPYSPVFGRFLATDPVEGGTANDYAYVTDPINDTDLTGKARCSVCGWGGPGSGGF